MTDPRFARLQEIFHAAGAIPKAERDAFLRSECGADRELLDTLQGMLAAPSVGFSKVLDAALQPEPTPEAPTTIERLAARAPAYEVEGELGRGGMGQVFLVHDRELSRRLALKITNARGADAAQTHARFVTEAKIMARLDHPGVPPVHELNHDGGQPYFTMRRVPGKTARQVFTAARAAQDGWTRTRALDVLQRVCDTMAYANRQGILHRDLKTENVMVGDFGEVYVMDWGLAKVLGASDADAGAEQHAGVQPGYRTAPGAVGTPSFMPPEQAAGRTADVDERSDVYAVGAMLYELLAGAAPYCDAGRTPPTAELLAAVKEGPPTPIEKLDPGAPPELVSICRKAMARKQSERYATMLDFGADLRAFVERRVVSAYRTGPLVEARLWMARNRGVAASLAALLVVGVVALVWITVEKRNVQQQKGEFDQLAGVVLYDRAIANEEKLYPAWPDNVNAMKAWLREDCGKLLGMRDQIESTVQDLRKRALPQSGEEKQAALTAGRNDAGGWTFAEEAPRFLHDTLCDLLAKLTRLEVNEKAAVEQRLEWALRVGELSRSHPNARVTWAQARTAITASARYLGQNIELREPDVIGLVPIGMNPVTKLWEFYELRSAWDGTSDPAQIQIPSHQQDGSIALTGDTGIVFVLLPGGPFVMGAQKADEQGQNYEPQALDDESPVAVTLAPFFLARHELTKGQWQRLSGEPERGGHRIGVTYGGDPEPVGFTHPVEQVNLEECDLLLTRLGLALPTEAQWEYGCRAGTSTPWWPGPLASDLAGCANCLDKTGERAHPSWGRQEGDIDDGRVSLAPVAQYRANAFGLHDMHGNLWEWCIDEYGRESVAGRTGDGRRLRGDGSADRVARGGSFSSPARFARSSLRRGFAPSIRVNYLGLRPTRASRRTD